jgi:hypothetical protein
MLGILTAQDCIRYRSQADIGPRMFDVRFTPITDIHEMSAKCHKPTLILFDRFVGKRQQFFGHFESEKPSGLKIYDEAKLGRQQNRQVRRLGSLENASGVNARLPMLVG